MGTRAVITFQGDYNAVMLYRHYDGSPDSVLPDLKEFRKLALENNFWGYGKNNPSRLALKFQELFWDNEYQPESKIDNWVEYLYWVYSTKDHNGDIEISAKELNYINIDKF
jgi:hypothetical protein